MTEQERYAALLNIQAALSVARGYVGASASLSAPLEPSEMDAMLEKAGGDAGALVAEMVTGADVPRPEGTQITTEEPLMVLPADTDEGQEKDWRLK